MQKTTPSTFVADPGRVRELATAVAKNKLSPVALVQRYLDRIAEADPHVQCWRQLDAERALGLAEEREREASEGRIRGPLHGVPVAIKDIIDVEGLPTRANSRSRLRSPSEAASRTTRPSSARRSQMSRGGFTPRARISSATAIPAHRGI